MYVRTPQKESRKKNYIWKLWYFIWIIICLFYLIVWHVFFSASRHFHERKRAQMRRFSQTYVCQELLVFVFFLDFFLCVWCISPSLSHTRVYRNVTIASKVLQFFMYIVDSWLIYCAVGHDLTYSNGKCFSAWKNS